MTGNAHSQYAAKTKFEQNQHARYVRLVAVDSGVRERHSDRGQAHLTAGLAFPDTRQRS